MVAPVVAGMLSPVHLHLYRQSREMVEQPAKMADGHIEPVAMLGTQALHIGVATGSGRIMERVVTLASMMDSGSTQTGVAEFVGEFERWKAASCPDHT